MNQDNEKLVNQKLTASDFEFVQGSTKIFDQKFETKPTTFFKDSIRRFSKNKSSIVGAIILGILILLSIFLPIFSPYDIKTVDSKQQFLAPKLFEAGTGFWDGTKEYTHIVYDTDNQTPAEFYKPAVLDLKVDAEPTLINQANKYGKGGYVMFVHENDTTATRTLYSYPMSFSSKEEAKVAIALSNRDNALEAKLGEYRINFIYDEKVGTDVQQKSIVLQEWSTKYENIELDISKALEDNSIKEAQGSIQFELKPGTGSVYSYLLIESVVFSSNTNDEEQLATIAACSFTDATQMVLLQKGTEGTPLGYWTCNGRKGIFESKIYYCDFTFDTYANVYDAQVIAYAKSDFFKKTEQYSGEVVKEKLPKDPAIDGDLYSFSYENEYIKISYQAARKKKTVGFGKFFEYVPGSFEWSWQEELTQEQIDNAPISGVDEDNPVLILSDTGELASIYTEALRYKKMGYDEMPKFLFGTDVSGHDLLKKAFSGLRTSLLLGVCTAIFCFAFGLVWGSISGYFGGNVDLFMERFCEILSGVPWIVIMTLCILHLGNSFGTFVLALCLTGWMGTAGRTRTQFYRFKGREYVLASRTLGSSDIRLIFKHILPNSLGTIITSSVFMITSVIFSEASLAYLNLGLQGLDSFGVLMSENQSYISSSPNLVVFPAVIITLMMISFNLFGNGLRDAVNPSLKGSD